MMTLPLKNKPYSAIAGLILKIFSVLATNILINKDYSPLNKNSQSLLLKFFDSQGTNFHYMINRKIDLSGCS